MLLAINVEESGSNRYDLEGVIFWHLPSGNESDRKGDSQAEHLVDQPKLELGTSQIEIWGYRWTTNLENGRSIS
jgi:hypothetical protein